ncbi:hypothetical protein GUJ93_ZPchr0286g2803 [Zizania palustris]|uniref:Uncharacterized protein n=1 Tax=Zizania palustris TaxID=103762 RepID=A0A8J5RYI2_ZIZPA|nr:hypothetical protein GUJ93_ZPchr0008g13584 [Zizania palustris]KAG8081603.1 hypothetical protein GUJ93_ZPchr0286g2803 [Zizania palustris]
MQDSRDQGKSARGTVPLLVARRASAAGQRECGTFGTPEPGGGRRPSARPQAARRECGTAVRTTAGGGTPGTQSNEQQNQPPPARDSSGPVQPELASARPATRLLLLANARDSGLQPPGVSA